ncbi:MAG: cytidylate kinase-like family protein [Corallococcus sp.]|nr:cytidylate kinase-like family protein [Corallococcus sp.]
MNRIITVSREFGSGGRELAKRLAEKLGFAFYDKEIIAEIAQNRNVDEQYLEKMRSGVYNDYPYAVGKSFSYYSAYSKIATELLLEERKVILDAASKCDCVIVGRGADLILRKYSPFDIFVYADDKSKIERCKKRAPENETLSDKELLKKIKQIDKSREKHYLLLGGDGWGRKENYRLCVDTTDVDLNKAVPLIAEYAKIWLEGK